MLHTFRMAICAIMIILVQTSIEKIFVHKHSAYSLYNNFEVRLVFSELHFDWLRVSA